MARFEVSADDFIDKLKSIPERFENEAAGVILRAGAEVVVSSWKSSIEAHGHVRSHSMLENVDMTEVKRDSTNSVIDVFPMGEDARGVRNAMKAYVINYGMKKAKSETANKTGDKFVREAERNAEQKVHEAQQRALDEFLRQKGLT